MQSSARITYITVQTRKSFSTIFSPDKLEQKTRPCKIFILNCVRVLFTHQWCPACVVLQVGVSSLSKELTDLLYFTLCKRPGSKDLWQILINQARKLT